MIKKIIGIFALSATAMALEPSLIEVPPPITVEATSPEGAPVEYSVQVPPGSSVDCVPPPGSVMPVGQTVVDCDAVHRDNNSFTVNVTAFQYYPTIGLPTEATGTDGAGNAIMVPCEPISETEVECTTTNAQGNTATKIFTSVPLTSVDIYLIWDAPTTDDTGEPIPEDEIARYHLDVLNTDTDKSRTYITPTNAPQYTLFAMAHGNYDMWVMAENVLGELSNRSDVLRLVI